MSGIFELESQVQIRITHRLGNPGKRVSPETTVLPSTELRHHSGKFPPVLFQAFLSPSDKH